MDAKRFDSLATVVGRWTTRRSALTLVAGLGLGVLDPAVTEAAKCRPTCTECQHCQCKKKHGKKCRCRSRNDETFCANPEGGFCQNGVCSCRDATNCFGSCVNLQFNAGHCGTCGNACTITQVCTAGTCFPQSVCPANQTSLCDPASVACGTNCSCAMTVFGSNVVCAQNEDVCGPPVTITNCHSNADCPTGEACVYVGGCCTPALPAGSTTCMAKCASPTI
jgi:hypothetical protein